MKSEGGIGNFKKDITNLNNLINEKDCHDAHLKSELTDIKSYVRQIREGAKKCVWNKKGMIYKKKQKKEN